MCNHKKTTPLMLIGQLLFGLLIIVIATIINAIWRTVGLLVFIFRPEPKRENLLIEVSKHPRLITTKHEVIVDTIHGIMVKKRK